MHDIEQIRQLLGIESWTILGLSWGTTLGLAYAQAHPKRVGAAVLALVTATSRREVRWLTEGEGVGRIFPDQFERFAAAVPRQFKERPMVDAYARMLFAPDPATREHAAKAWCAWEDAHVSLTPGHTPNPRFENPEFRLRFARLVTHYWRNAAFLNDEQLIRNAATLNGIPGYLIHGRYDVSSPLDTAWHLSNNWKTSNLRVLNDTGHGGGDSFIGAIVDALKET
jgi:proline iminopeptidase